MFRVACIAVTLLLLDADVPRIFRLRPQPAREAEFPPDQTLPALPELLPTSPQRQSGRPADRLQPESRLDLVRFVSGEFARAVRPLPGGKKGFRIKAGEGVNEKALRQAIANSGPAVNTGDNVQISRLEFREKEIVIDINGGGRRRSRWRDRIQVSISGAPRPTVATSGSNPAPGQQGQGATVYLDFDRPLPDITPAELKQHLAGVLDFSKQRSASVQWVETLPPAFRKAIEEKRAMLGMDREMVVAAMGRPERKIRERDPAGIEIEDWIYGQPPGKTIFVRFVGDKVIAISEFPR